MAKSGGSIKQKVGDGGFAEFALRGERLPGGGRGWAPVWSCDFPEGKSKIRKKIKKKSENCPLQKIKKSNNIR